MSEWKKKKKKKKKEESKKEYLSTFFKKIFHSLRVFCDPFLEMKDSSLEMKERQK